MNPCDLSTCGYAHGGECDRSCPGLQLHRPVLPDKLAPAVIVEGRVEQRTEHRTEPAPEISRARLALNTFNHWMKSKWQSL